MGVYKKGRPCKYIPATKKGRIPPKTAGEYRICTARGKIVYIGETCNLYRRMQEHIRSGKIVLRGRNVSTFLYQVASAESTSTSRREHEKKKIRKHKPKKNKSSGGEGRKAS